MYALSCFTFFAFISLKTTSGRNHIMHLIFCMYILLPRFSKIYVYHSVILYDNIMSSILVDIYRVHLIIRLIVVIPKTCDCNTNCKSVWNLPKEFLIFSIICLNFCDKTRGDSLASDVSEQAGSVVYRMQQRCNLQSRRL